MFEDAKVGDRVWHVIYGWGTVTEINFKSAFPIYVKFVNVADASSFTKEGWGSLVFQRPVLFWDEVKIPPPPRPKWMVKRYVNLWWQSEIEKTTRKRRLVTGFIHNTKSEALIAGATSVKSGVEIEIEE